METDLTEASAADNVSAGDLSIDVLANILGYLDGPKDIMQKRRVCKKWKEAVKMTIVPPTYFRVDSVDKYNAISVMTRALPNLQQITLRNLDIGDKYSDGEDPHEALAAGSANWTTHDIEIISNFRKLQILDIYGTVLNGRYRFLFHNFPLLEKLSIIECDYLKWDLEMLAGFPQLKELECGSNLSGINKCMTGNIRSLRVLKDALEKLSIIGCENVVGNFMDLADFPHLKVLNLFGTAVTGDIRDIGANGFTTLENLELPKGVYGGRGYRLQRISDGPDLLRTLYVFNKQRPNLIDSLYDLYWTLMEGSPERYESVDNYDTPPFFISFVKAGSRLGYRWKTNHGRPCEVNWIDPEPDRESSDYGKYIEELEQINSEVHMFRRFHQPPTEEEYNRLCEEYN